ncbi:MAG: hypothetical protein GXY56_00975 [Clostridiales bacterium]|nr:hypothetical protein [Clostridiales bacterium]
MRSKAFYSNVFSLPLALENLKRFWAIGTVGLLIYLLSGAFPLVLSYDRIRPYMIETMLSNHNPGYMAAHLFLAISAAVAVFRYLQNTGSAGVMHAMPFSRKSLYLSSYASGLTLAYLPAFINGLVLLVLKTPVYQTVYVDNLPIQTDIYTAANVLGWMAEVLVIITFVYSIGVFAGMVTGSMVLHALTALGFNFLLTALYATFLGYSEIYFFGFTYNRLISDITLKLSPYTYVFQAEGDLRASAWPMYMVAAVLIAAGTYFIYKKRPLEKATESTVFRFMEHFLSFLIVFFGSSLTGMVFYENDYGYAGYVLGGILGFLVGQMIVKKTLKIFDLENLKTFVVFAGIMAVVIVGFNKDALGYERRIPQLGSVETVTIDSYDLMQGNRPLVFQETENVRALTDFHQFVIDRREAYRDHQGFGFGMTLTYDLDSGNQMSRRYHLPYEAVMESESLRKLYESDEADKPAEMLSQLQMSDTEIVLFSGNNYESEQLTMHYSDDVLSNSAKRLLLDALSRDLKEMTFRRLVSGRAAILQLQIQHRTEAGGKNADATSETYPYMTGKEDSNYRYEFFGYGITAEYEHTLRWITENGYEHLLTAIGTGDFAVIRRNCEAEEEEGVTHPVDYDRFTSVDVKHQSEPGSLVLEDPEAITMLIRDHAYRDLRHFPAEEDALCLTVYHRSEDKGYGMFEAAMRYYLNEADLPEVIRAEADRYLSE